jgi:hypothetical protein
MSRDLKITAALFLTFAFVFRLLSVNIGLLSSISNRSENSRSCKHLSEVQKRRRLPAFDVQSDTKESGFVEICEESSDNEEESSKTSIPFLLAFIQSAFNPADIFTSASASFDRIKCAIFPKKYLSLSILRI